MGEVEREEAGRQVPAMLTGGHAGRAAQACQTCLLPHALLSLFFCLMMIDLMMSFSCPFRLVFMPCLPCHVFVEEIDA